MDKRTATVGLRLAACADMRASLGLRAEPRSALALMIVARVRRRRRRGTLGQPAGLLRDGRVPWRMRAPGRSRRRPRRWRHRERHHGRRHRYRGRLDHPEFTGAIDDDSIDIVTGSAATVGDVDGHGTRSPGHRRAAQQRFEPRCGLRSQACGAGAGSCPACAFDQAHVAAATDHAVSRGARDQLQHRRGRLTRRRSWRCTGAGRRGRRSW